MKFWADENLHGDILHGILAAYPDLDITRVQDTQLSGAEDATLLEEAAKQGVIIITHDVQTMTKYAYDRVRAGLPMAGVIEVAENMPIGQAINDLVLIIGASFPEDFENQVIYVPLY
jgi:predicted nuclease of predicted toxin-antitoxin system